MKKVAFVAIFVMVIVFVGNTSPLMAIQSESSEHMFAQAIDYETFENFTISVVNSIGTNGLSETVVTVYDETGEVIVVVATVCKHGATGHFCKDCTKETIDKAVKYVSGVAKDALKKIKSLF